MNHNSEHFLLVSKFYTPNLLPELSHNSKCGLDFAAHNLCKAIIKGFKENQVDLDVINVPNIGSYPIRYKKIIIKSDFYENINSISFCNISLIKRKSIKENSLKEIRKWCKNHTGNKVIILYNFELIGITKTLKDEFPDIKICMIITDLPEFMSTSKGLKSKIINLFGSSIYKNSSSFNYIDGFILLAEKMKDKLPITNKRHLLIEGIYNSEIEVDGIQKAKEKIIMYTGSLGSRYGIKNLVEAFTQIPNSDYRLWIRGNGELEDFVKEKSKEDDRIVYIGKLSRKELLLRQKMSTVLINPVFSKEIFTNYFFPSKTLEYLASGTPTIMCKLSCIPEDYKNFIYFIDDESVEGIKNKITEICEKSPVELMKKGAESSQFIYTNKSPKPQIRKLLNFIYSL